jgi:integrase
MPTRRLTDQFVERVKPPAKGRVSYFDAAFPSLELRHSEFDHKAFYLLYRMPGDPRLRRIKLGIYPHIKPARARALATEAINKIHTGIDPGADRRRDRGTAPEIESIDSLIHDYLAQHVSKNCSTGTFTNAKRMLQVDVLPAWRGRTISSITKRDCVALIGRIAERAPVHGNRVLTRVKHMFEWAVGKDRLALSPVRAVEKPTKEKSRDRWLNEQEITWLWQACNQLGHPFGTFIKVLLLTGQRRSETSQMEWAEVDLDSALWTIPAAKAKSDRAHEVQLAPQLIEILRTLPKSRPFVFTGKTGRGITGYAHAKKLLDAAMQMVSGGAQIPEFILHDLRRTAASHMAKLGVAPHVVDRILNHSSGTIRGVAAVYNRFEYENERRSALAAWSNYVTGLTASAANNVVTLGRK